MRDLLTQPLQLQTVDFLLSILLGCAIGLWYDALRGVRHVFGVRKWWAVGLIDLLFGAVVAVGLFLFTVLAIGGRLRIWTGIGLCGGGVLYFSMFSTSIYGIWTVLLRSFWKCLQGLIQFFRKIFKKYAKKTSLFGKKEVQ